VNPSAPEECLTIRTTQAERGYELARIKQPDVVAVDVATAGGPGWALCRLLKRDPMTSAIPVVVLASDSPEIDAHARFAGVSGVLPELASIADVLTFVREPLPESSAA
jgi:CheY-like chemotaxis protein